MTNVSKVLNSGDNISTLAEESGLLPETIWNDPANKSLKNKKKSQDAIGKGDTVTLREIEPKKFAAPTGKSSRFKVKLNRGFTLRLDLGAAQSDEIDEEYTLKATDGSYSETRSSRDDLIPDDDFLDIHFSGLDPRKTYSLEVDDGSNGGVYKLFEDVAFDDLFGLAEEKGVEPTSKDDSDDEVGADFAEDESDEE